MKAKTNKPKLVLEVNKKFIDGDKNIHKLGNAIVMVTPKLDEDYWQFRVKVDKDQAIVGFPKFSTIGIGFAKEVNWNTNLPYDTDTTHLWNHIKENKYYTSIPDELCLEAIKMVQKAAKEFFEAEKEMENMIVFGNEPMLKDEKTGKFLSKKEFKERCVILKGRMAEFETSFGQKHKKRKFCFLFGRNPEFGSYKYKVTTYDFSLDMALLCFMQRIRTYNLNGGTQTRQFETFQVAKFEEGKVGGYKIPIAF